MSAAVMPMRRTVSAAAIRGSPATAASASIKAAAVARLCPDFSLRIAAIPSQLLVTICYAIVCNGYAKRRELLVQLLWAAQVLGDPHEEKTLCLIWHQPCKSGLQYPSPMEPSSCASEIRCFLLPRP